jgi:antitoxin component of RelBE/YafQ-DinJ toxin-antitoxin module
MIIAVAKSTSINLRITPSFRNELQALADYRGLTLSSLAHSLLVKAIRQEKQNEPEAFAESERIVNDQISRQNGITLAENSPHRLKAPKTQPRRKKQAG